MYQEWKGSTYLDPWCVLEVVGIHLPGSLECIGGSRDPRTLDTWLALEVVGSTYPGSRPGIGSSSGDPLTSDPDRVLEVVGIHLPVIPAVYWK